MNTQNKHITDDFIFDPLQTSTSGHNIDDFIFDPLQASVFPTAPKRIPKGAGRFRKIGKNAQHPLTIDMRRMKAELGLTTRELVKELSAYEKKFGFEDNERHGISRDFVPINAVSMSSYLQGWVLQQTFMEAVHVRMKKFHAHKRDSIPVSPNSITGNGIQDKFNEWFRELGISDYANGAPVRAFAKMIAPYFKRPVSAKFEGVFNLGASTKGIEQSYTITDDENNVHEFILNRAEEVLIKSGTIVKRSDIIQYSVLYPIVTTADGRFVFDTSQPSTDHTTFYRWYTANKSPRSIQVFDFIEDAVKQAKNELLKAKA